MAFPTGVSPAFYFFYFAYLGAFAPFFSLYLSRLGIAAVEIGVLMSLPQLMRIVAPHLWGWLADRGRAAARASRGSPASPARCVFWACSPARVSRWLFAVLLTMTFFWSAALPLVEATTLSHLGEHTARYGRIRVWGSIGFIVAVVAVGYVLDWLPVSGAVVDHGGADGRHACLLLAGARGDGSAARHATGSRSGQIVQQPEVIALIAACALMAAAHGPYYTFYTIYLVDHGYSKARSGWLWALGVICEIGIFIWMPHLYRAFTLRRILIASFALAAVRFLIIGWGVDSRAAAVVRADPARGDVSAHFMPRRSASCTSCSAAATRRAARRFTAVLPSALGGTLGGLPAATPGQRLGPALTFYAGGGRARSPAC